MNQHQNQQANPHGKVLQSLQCSILVSVGVRLTREGGKVQGCWVNKHGLSLN
jgi:hypothetical protein